MEVRVINQAGNPDTAETFVRGGYFQRTATISAPGTIAASGTFTSALILTDGLTHLAASAQLTNAGTLVVTRYLDQGGSISVGAPIIQALTANTLSVLDNNDGKLFQSVTYGVVNGGGSAGTLTNGALVLQGG